jgi:DNA-directed RNA polymerase specialized sigma subunit
MTNQEFNDVFARHENRVTQKSRDMLREIFVNGRPRADVAKEAGIGRSRICIIVNNFKKLLES